MNANIELKKGFGDLLFGQSIGQVIELVGKPDQVEQIGEDVEMPTTVLHYEELQMSLFFRHRTRGTPRLHRRGKP